MNYPLYIVGIVVNNEYLKQRKLYVQKLQRGFAWFDAGTIDDLMAASEFVRHVENRQGQKICCPEEIALFKGWLNPEQLSKSIKNQKKHEYNKYLLEIIKELG